MIKMDDIVSKHIGDLTIASMKQTVMIQAMKAEIDKRDEQIRQKNAHICALEVDLEELKKIKSTSHKDEVPNGKPN